MPQDLVDHLRSLELGPRQVALWWLGQAGFFLRRKSAVVLVDPFLSAHPRRLYDAGLQADRVKDVDIIACTHEHNDHFDQDAVDRILHNSPEAVIVAPAPVIETLRERGVNGDQLIIAHAGTSIDRADVTVRPIPALHGLAMEDAYTFGTTPDRHLGYVFDLGGVRIYHAGDSLVYEGLADQLQSLSVEVALLPINGRDYFRERDGVVGNMDHREAARLALDADVDLLVPMHYETFAHNRGYPAHLADVVRTEYPSVAIMFPTRTRPFVYTSLRTSQTPRAATELS